MDSWFACGAWEVSASCGSLADLAPSFFALFTFTVDTEVAHSAASNKFTNLADFLAFVVQLTHLALLSFSTRVEGREVFEGSLALAGVTRLTRLSLAEFDLTRLVFRASFANISMGILATKVGSSISFHLGHFHLELVAQFCWFISRNQKWRMRLFVWLRTDS